MLRFSSLALALLFFGLIGCTDSPDAPPANPAATSAGGAPVPLENRADSIAFRIAEASGGFAAWRALPALRFEFGVERGGQQQVSGRHYWGKAQDRYRVEWPGGGDTVYVALFSAWPDSATVYADGTPLTGAAADEALATAQRRTINDTYWLAAPLKLFDPGVTRTYAPDSSDATHDAIRLSFDGVGITPGDQYWLFADKETGRLTRWTFLLESDTAPRSFEWTAYQTLQGPGGPVYLSARKELPSAPVAILTGGLQTPSRVDSTMFTDPTPRL
jgi:hypothetical protein